MFRYGRACQFCSWASENGSLLVQWASEISRKTLIKDEQNNELKA